MYLGMREILLSFQTGFSLVNAAVVCVILESISADLTNAFKTVKANTAHMGISPKAVGVNKGQVR